MIDATASAKRRLRSLLKPAINKFVPPPPKPAPLKPGPAPRPPAPKIAAVRPGPPPNPPAPSPSEKESRELLLKVSKDFQGRGYLRSALSSLELIPEPMRVNKHWHALADLYLAMGKYEDAAASLDRMQVRDLSQNGFRLYLITAARLAQAQGDTRKALDLVQRRRAAFPEHILEATVEYYRLYRHAHSDAEFMEFSDILFRTLPSHQLLAEIYAQHLYESNMLAKLKAFLQLYHPRFRRSGKLFVLEATCAWIDQDDARLANAFEIARHEKLVTRQVAEMVQRLRQHRPDAEEFAQEMIRLASDEDPAENITRLDPVQRAWVLLSLDEVEAALAILDTHIERENGPVLAFLVRGLAHHAAGNSAQSEADLKLVVKEAPQQVLAYRTLLQIGLERYPEMSGPDELIRYRNEHNPVFTRRDKLGRSGFHDVEAGQVMWFKGQYMEGYRAKLQKQTCVYLAAKFPAQYNVLEKPELADLEQKSVLVLGDDGVSDEVRYAYGYRMLPENCRAVITCEPRLHGLLSRSFPRHEFIAVTRRWPDLPIKVEDNRSGIDNVDFARIISQDLFDRIPTFDRLRFQQDLVAGRWLRQPGGAPCTEGAGTGAFLKPDQKLVRKWKSRMRFRANGAAAPLKVGLIWRSALQNARRSRQYLKIEQLAPLLEVKGAVLYSLQYDISEDEAAFCKSNGIRLLDDVDWRNDLETVAAVTSQLDLVIGISSSSYEIAAAVGTECWLLGVSPEALGLRLGDSDKDFDRITWNSRIIRPDLPAARSAAPDAPWPKENAVARAAELLQQRSNARDSKLN